MSNSARNNPVQAALAYFSDDGDHLTAENTDDSNHDSSDKIGIPLREQDRFLPIANVAKIMKKAIPETGKVTGQVKVNINDISSNICMIRKRKR